jgi:hydrogenase-4 membrane subunit HyfE
MKFAIIFIGMIWCHIIDDYCLQGILKDLKQKDWWAKQTDNKMYKNDYKVALLCHAFSWSCSISIIPLVYTIINKATINTINGVLFALIMAFIMNVTLHYDIDNMKANAKSINLVVDQLMHLAQIIITFIVWLCFIQI